MNWILILAIVVIAFLIFKSKEVKHKVMAFLIIGLILFFLFTFSQVVSNPEVNFDSFEGITSAAKLYFSWLGGVFDNSVRITGYAAKMDWGANFTSNITK